MIKSISMVAFAILAVTLGMTQAAHAQNATTTRPDHDRGDHFLGLGVRDHFLGGLGVRDHFGLGVRAHIGGLGAIAPVITTNGGAVFTNHIRPDFARFHDFAFAHHQHFILLNNNYVLLPETVGCPPGSNLDAATGECVIVQQAVIQQAAPTILSESVATPSTVITGQTTTSTTAVAPTITCPAGSTLQADNTCTVTTSQTQQVQPIVTCPAGTQIQNGACVEVQQQITVDPLPCPSCPAGSNLINGQCVVNALPSQVIAGQTAGEIVILGHHFEHHGGPLAFMR